MKKLFFSLVIMLATTLFVSGQKKILLVGDSWAETIWRSRAFDQVLQEYGYPAGLTEGGEGNSKEGNLTAIGGSRADRWGTNYLGWQERIKEHLEKNPSITFIHLIIGGNDLLNIIAKENISHWTVAQRDEQWNIIRENIRKLLTFCLDIRPEIQVVIADYDYLNIANADKAYQFTFGGMTQQQVNQYFVEVGLKKMELAGENDRVHYLQHWGVLNNHYANALPVARYLEGGATADLVERMPKAADVGDGVHPHPEAHKILLRKAMEMFYKDQL